MREIRFRAWDSESGFYRLEGSIKFGGSIESDWGHEKPEWILEQYTGLKDKNGKEIYEGDIVSRNTQEARSGAIQFACGIFGINWDYGQNQDPEWLEGSMYGSWCGNHNLRPIDDGFATEHMYVIGNIHKNPELLA